jgi:hypothetical protein
MEQTVKQFKSVSILSEELASKLKQFYLRNAALAAGYHDIEDWHNPIPKDFGTLPHARFERSRIYTAGSDTFHYSHHAHVCKFGSRYVAAWSGGLQHEDLPGQQVHYSVSNDGVRWDPYRCLAATDADSGSLRCAAGLCVSGQRLVAYCKTSFKLGQTCKPGMSFHKQEARIDAFVTGDCQTWKEYEGLLDYDVLMLEGPRTTRSGNLLCCAYCNRDDYRGPVVLLWDPREPWTEPEVVKIPCPEDGGQLIEGSWFQNEQECIFAFWRDETMSLRLYVSSSHDEGRTWTVPIRTDFPDSMARLSAGRLADRRYYIVGNSYPELLNRKYLMLSLSRDGMVFDSMYILADGPTHRRFEGRHKEDGYQYPHTLVDGDRLLVVFSVNKEDIECGILDTRRL